MDRIKSIPGQMVDEYKGIGKAVGKAVSGATAGLRARDAQMKKQYERSQTPEVKAEAERQRLKKEKIIQSIKAKKK